MGIIGRRLRGNPGIGWGLASILVLGAVYAARSPDPFLADPAGLTTLRSDFASQQELALDELARLQSMLRAALEEGRRGAALTVQGNDRPGPHLGLAADRIGAAEPLVAGVKTTLQRLLGDLRIARPSAAGLNPPLQPGQLTTIGAQLRTAADAANAFFTMRRATEATLAQLRDAFAAIDGRHPAEAIAALDAANQTLGRVRGWPGSLQTLPIWVATTTDLLVALRALAVAIRNNDLPAARAAEARYRSVAGRAHQADLALALAIAEGGNDVIDAPLASAALALRAVDGALAEARSILV